MLGYIFGYVVAKIFRLPNQDAIAISIETGVQNFAITIFLIQFSLEQPAIDIAMVFIKELNENSMLNVKFQIIPASVAIMTQIPLLILYIIKKL